MSENQLRIKFKMEKEYMDPKEALTVSLDYEKKVRDHYAKGAEKIQDERGKKVFETLAREEQGHVDYLQSRLDAWVKTGKVEPGELKSILPSVEWIKEARKKVARKPSKKIAEKTELELLSVALELERKTSTFYKELVDTLDSQHRELFERFLEIENAHVALVQAEIDSLTGMGAWFDFLEVSFEAG